MFEELPSLSPLQFFGIVADAHFFPKKNWKPDSSFLLPLTSEWTDEEPFADVYAAWNFEKLLFHVAVKNPSLGEGDSIELFIDTRDLKSKGVVSRFCHHFIFYPHQVQGFYGREITRFRGEETHRLCHPEDLVVTPTVQARSYSLLIEISASCLTGYDPIQSPRLGFTYRISRTGGLPQHFSASSEEYALELHPAVWGTLKLVSGEER